MAKRQNKAAMEQPDDLEVMRKRYRRGRDAVKDLYAKAIEDVRFITVPGSQWDERLRAARRDRAMYEFPKLRLMVIGIINEIKQNRPQGKVRGTEEGDRGLAELMQGICRNIESQSNAERAYDIGAEFSVKGGFGVWRICTDYKNDDDFDQDIFIRPVRNPFSVTFDPAAVEIDRRDGRFAFVEELVPEETILADKPDADLSDFFDDNSLADWREKGQVKRAEYWYKKPVARQLWMLADGRTEFADELADRAGVEIDEAREILAAAGIAIVKEREVRGHKVCMRLTNGREWLSEEYAFPSKFIPLVPVWGNIDNLEGEDYFSGAVRFGKDQQRLHNLHRTAMIETVAKAPKAPYVLKKKWIEGFEPMWNKANAEDFPYLPVNDQAPDNYMPQRTQPAQIPAALIQLAGMDNDDMKAATGQFDASLGARSNETSGKAINLRRAQGANSTFNYLDYVVEGIRFTYEILVDMIPRVFDTARVVRVLGADGGEKWKQLYQEVVDPQTGETVVLNDISKGKYDVTVTVGPTYATQRMEAVDAFTQLAGQIGGSFPAIAPLLSYFVVHNLDLPGADELDSILRKMLVQQGLLQPKDGEEPPQPQQPDPRMMAELRKILAGAAKDEATAAKTAAETQTILPEAMVKLRQVMAETTEQQLQNMIQTGELAAMLSGPPPVAPPAALPAPMQAPQPAEAGFLMPGPPGAPQALPTG